MYFIFINAIMLIESLTNLCLRKFFSFHLFTGFKRRSTSTPIKSRKNSLLKSETPRSSLECHLCGEVATSRFYFSQHMAEAHSDQLPFHCTLCGKAFVSSSGLRHHKQTHKGQSFACAQCHRRFTHKHHLRDHEKRTGHNLFSFKTE